MKTKDLVVFLILFILGVALVLGLTLTPKRIIFFQKAEGPTPTPTPIIPGCTNLKIDGKNPVLFANDENIPILNANTEYSLNFSLSGVTRADKNRVMLYITETPEGRFVDSSPYPMTSVSTSLIRFGTPRYNGKYRMGIWVFNDECSRSCKFGGDGVLLKGEKGSQDNCKILSDYLGHCYNNCESWIQIVNGVDYIPPPTPTVTGAAVTPSLTPTPVVTENYLNFKVRFEGLPEDKQSKLVTITIPGKIERKVVVKEDGTYLNFSLDELKVGESYSIFLSSHPFLTVKKSLTVLSGRNPASGFFDFGTLKSGDLNGDNQVNGLDWSIMKLNYGESGEE